MNEEKMREEFERTFTQPPYEFDLAIQDHEGAWPNTYIYYHVQCAWEGYQAACASKQKEIDDLVEAQQDIYEKGYSAGIMENQND